jgi:reverse transcriptase-like protein
LTAALERLLEIEVDDLPLRAAFGGPAGDVVDGGLVPAHPDAALKLVLEPIFEADFQPSSYGFRPRRRAQDAIAEIHYLASPTRSYEWVFEADIAACFDEIDHTALMGRLRARISDKRVLGLVKAFLAAGVLGEDAVRRDTITGTPQGGILSPLLANIALSALDEHFARKWEALGPQWPRAKAGSSRCSLSAPALPDLEPALELDGHLPRVRCRGLALGDVLPRGLSTLTGCPRPLGGVDESPSRGRPERTVTNDRLSG